MINFLVVKVSVIIFVAALSHCLLVGNDICQRTGEHFGGPIDILKPGLMASCHAMELSTIRLVLQDR
jgi:hypothetical protein